MKFSHLALAGLSVCLSAGLAACEKPAAAPVAEIPPASGGAAAAQPDIVADGEPVSVAAEAETSDAAYVVQIAELSMNDARVFSTVGGDPAINGLYTYVTLFTSPVDPQPVYMIGDFNEWEVVSEQAGMVVLKVSRSHIAEDSGDVVTNTEYLIVNLPPAPVDGAAPGAVLVTKGAPLSK